MVNLLWLIWIVLGWVWVGEAFHEVWVGDYPSKHGSDWRKIAERRASIAIGAAAILLIAPTFF
jgi:hypothetical protein